MKHLLNNMTEEEKNSIREHYTGKLNVVTENFSKLVNTKSGDVKLYLNEQNALSVKVDPNWLKTNGWVVVKDNGKVLQPTFVKTISGSSTNTIGSVGADDYDYVILQPQTNSTYACQTMNTAGGRPSCYSNNGKTKANVSKTEDIAKAKTNVGLS